MVVGIGLANFINIDLKTSLFLFGMGCIILLVIYAIIPRHKTLKSLFDVLTPFIFLLLGLVLLELHTVTNHPGFIGNKKIDITNPHLVQFKIDHRLKPTQYYERYEVELEYVDKNPVLGKAILRITKSDSLAELPMGGVGSTTSILQTIGNPLNPGNFNYRTYLEKKGIYYQITTDSRLIEIEKIHTYSISYLADKFKKYIKSKFKSGGLQGDQLAITSALLLGEREDISPELNENYAAAGAIHLLAISGLHIGIIYLFLSISLAPLKRYGVKGRTTHALIIVVLLWTFAILSGLAPSVVRAVTMFSLFAVASLIKRRPHTINVIAISAFILLLIKPRLLFDVGFQLSYMAVLAIVILQPKLYNWLKTDSKIANYFIALISVSVTAQIGVLPLSLYYFHQFPTLFIISNIILIPLVTVILVFGLILTFTIVVSGITVGLIPIYEKLIDLMNLIVHSVAEQEQFLLSNVSFNSINLITLYFLICTIVILLHTKKFYGLILVLVGIILVQAGIIYNWKTEQTQLVVFQKTGETLIAQNQYGLVTVFSDTLSQETSKIIEAYETSIFADVTQIQSPKNVYKLNDRYILKIDSLNIWLPIKELDVVLLTQSPKLNLERLIDSLNPKLIIADGSNYFNYITAWEETCNKRKLPFHATHKIGAYIIE